MKAVSLADAKAHLSEVVDRVTAGKSIAINWRGKPVAQLTAVDAPPLIGEVVGVDRTDGQK